MKKLKIEFIIALLFFFFYNTILNSKNIIISLTSYPPRIKSVHITIKSLIKQTLKPNLIILWLAESEFPNRDSDLTKDLLALKSNRIKIEYYEKNIKSYKKLIPTFREIYK